MDEASAELTKYAANSFLATKISFMNEVANLCEQVGANVDMVRKGIGSDDRIGRRFLFPGVGYGGSCFPKDVLALLKSSDEAGYDFKILNAVIAVNKRQRENFVARILSYYGGDVAGKKFAIWGLAFKPETDDIREAPAVHILESLLNVGAKLHVYDPEAMKHIEKNFGSKIDYGHDEYDTLTGADALIIVTEWSLFRNPDFEKMKSSLKAPVIFDGRNLYDLDKMQELGFYYSSIGRQLID